MKRLIVLTTILLWATAANAQKVYDFNDECKKAYHDITSLRIEPGKKWIAAARQKNPDNLIPYLLEGYIDFFELFLNEDPEQFKQRKDNFALRNDMFESGPQQSPFYRYCRAVNLLQRAAVRIKFGERYSAVFDFKKGYGLIKDNRKSFPQFLPNNLIYAPLTVAIGTVPDGYKVYTNILGMKGSITDGMQLMRSFVNSPDPWAKLFFNEAAFYYCYLAFYLENKPAEVMKFIQNRQLDMVNNHLFAYLGANLGINNKQTEFAKSVVLNRKSSGDYLQSPVWDFELGYAKMYHLQLKEAIIHFENFIADFKGRFYVKDVLQKLSWCYYLLGDSTQAEAYRQKTLRLGGTDADADKKALKDARSGSWPHPLLLKARLLSDGGYNSEALNLLDNKKPGDFANPAEALELVYRLARIYDDMGRDDDAIKYYRMAIEMGEGRKEYYAARAALQMGYIFESRNQKQQAIRYFEKCISIKDHEYKDSLDQRAKSGIKRCTGE